MRIIILRDYLFPTSITYVPLKPLKCSYFTIKPFCHFILHFRAPVTNKHTHQPSHQSNMAYTNNNKYWGLYIFKGSLFPVLQDYLFIYCSLKVYAFKRYIQFKGVYIIMLPVESIIDAGNLQNSQVQSVKSPSKSLDCFNPGEASQRMFERLNVGAAKRVETGEL